MAAASPINPTVRIKLDPVAVEVSVSTDALHVSLADRREVSAPLAWLPRLLKATKEQRENRRLIGGDIGIHWEDVDEDISVESLLSSR